MKIMIVFVLLMIAMRLPQAIADGNLHISRTGATGNFTLTAQDRLIMNSRYGNIHINTWDRSEMTVDITVVVTAPTDEAAGDLAMRITLGTGYSQKTHEVHCYNDVPKSFIPNRGTTVAINYTINMPESTPVDVTDEFGNVDIGSLKGSLNADVSYGSLNIEKCSAEGNTIKIAYGSATINTMGSGNISGNFSPVKIGTAQDLNINSKFGTVNIGSVNSLTLTQSSGGLTLGTAGEVHGAASYGDVAVKKLLRMADMNFKYCGHVDFGSIGAGVKHIDLDADYSNISCHFDKGVNMSVKVHSKYSEIRHDHASLATDNFTMVLGDGQGTMNVNMKYGQLEFK